MLGAESKSESIKAESTPGRQLSQRRSPELRWQLGGKRSRLSRQHPERRSRLADASGPHPVQGLALLRMGTTARSLSPARG